MFNDIDNIIKSSGVISLNETIVNLKNYLKELNYNIRFIDEDIKNIFITYQKYSSYRYSFKLDSFIKNLINKENDIYKINYDMKQKLKDIKSDSSFNDYKIRILENIMEYLKKLNKFNSSFIDNYFKIKDEVSNLVKENYNSFISLCYKNLYEIKFTNRC